MAPLPEGVTYPQWLAVYNALSFGIAGMGSAMIFVWLQLPNVKKQYRTALVITGLVVAIATYHYVRIFNSWNAAFNVTNGGDASKDYVVSLSGEPFNDAYRYVDWLLTVPLLLLELICVMDLPADDAQSLGWKLGVSSGLMVALGYPGEIQDDPAQRWVWWGLSMCPFCFVVFTLVIGLGDATNSQVNKAAQSLLIKARYLTVVSWLTYPGVYIIKMMGIGGAKATVYEQIGYSISDFVAKAVFGILIWAIAAAKSNGEPLAEK
jgi:bacteriorhodopsin